MAKIEGVYDPDDPAIVHNDDPARTARRANEEVPKRLFDADDVLGPDRSHDPLDTE